MSKGPGRFGVITSASVNEDRGVIQLNVEKYIHGVLNTVDEETFMLTPEEAHDIGQSLLTASEDGYATALTARRSTSV